MRTKKLNGDLFVYNSDDGGNTERYEYECPCGKGRVIEEHDNIVGFRDHNVWIACEDCSKKYYIDLSKGYRNWSIERTSEV